MKDYMSADFAICTFTSTEPPRKIFRRKDDPKLFNQYLNTFDRRAKRIRNSFSILLREYAKLLKR